MLDPILNTTSCIIIIESHVDIGSILYYEVNNHLHTTFLAAYISMQYTYI